MSEYNIAARPTVYNGVAMRSRTEAKVAAALDAIGAEWTYETQCYASEEGQYLPDFRVHNAEDHDGEIVPLLLIEVRPTIEHSIATLASDTAIVRASAPSAVLISVGWEVPPIHGCTMAGDNPRHAAALFSLRGTPRLLFGRLANYYIEGWLNGARFL